MYPNMINLNFFKVIALAVLVIFIAGVFLAEQHEPERLLWDDGFYIENVIWNETNGQMKAIVRNFGINTYTLSQIYVNGTLDNDCLVVPKVLGPDQTAEITLSKTYTVLPWQISIRVSSDNHSVSQSFTFIEFKMLRVYWNETTSKINVLVSNTGDYPDVNFGQIYINGTLDESAVVTQKNFQDQSRHQTYDISLSGKYVKKPIKMLLKIVTADGKIFELKSPFIGSISIDSIKWFESTGEIKFLVYTHLLEGEKEITFDEIYINGTLDESAVVTRLTTAQIDEFHLSGNNIYDVALSGRYASCPSEATVKVVTDFGEFCESYDNNLVG
ncbi:MAG: hypothetical protein P8Y18_10085 [Candidatus Bathyarchaeota archaeon]